MQLKNNVYISGQEFYLPSKISKTVEHEEELSKIYKLLNIKIGRLGTSTNIHEKRIEEKLSIPEMAAIVANKLVQKLNSVDEKLDGIIFCGISREFLEPSTSISITEKLGIKYGLFTLDVSSGCTGFFTAMNIGSTLIDSGILKNCIIVSAESSLSMIRATIHELNDLMIQYEQASESSMKNFQQDFKNKNSFDGLKNIKDIQKIGELKNTIKDRYSGYASNLLMGSGAAAYLLTNQNSKINFGVDEKIKISGFYSQSFAQYAKLCVGKSMDTPTYTNAIGLSIARPKHIKNEFDHSLNVLGWHKNDIDFYIMNQLNRNHANHLAQIIEIDLTKLVTNYENYGIAGTIVIPSTLNALLSDLNGVPCEFKFHKAEKIFDKSKNKNKNIKIMLIGTGIGINYSFIGIEIIKNKPSSAIISKL